MYLVSYDITSDKRRRKIAKELENYGRRVQYSVFECELDKARFSQLYKKLVLLMEGEAEGNIRIYTICVNCIEKLMTIGLPRENYPEDEDLIII
ncbi:MAG: CRISPR-associated endonuclease Cas2 [Lachnospiraceae bacterium]|nr:CRISPR-associated endonuclease Cas2 [Lachnospiraceae bacterium]